MARVAPQPGQSNPVSLWNVQAGRYNSAGSNHQSTPRASIASSATMATFRRARGWGAASARRRQEPASAWSQNSSLAVGTPQLRNAAFTLGSHNTTSPNAERDAHEAAGSRTRNHGDDRRRQGKPVALQPLHLGGGNQQEDTDRNGKRCAE